MTLLTHDHGRSHHAARQVRTENCARTPIGASREGRMRGFFRFAVTIFLSTAVMAGIVALKAGIYLSHFNH
jgi:hypothetical protein